MSEATMDAAGIESYHHPSPVVLPVDSPSQSPIKAPEGGGRTGGPPSDRPPPGDGKSPKKWIWAALALLGTLCAFAAVKGYRLVVYRHHIGPEKETALAITTQRLAPVQSGVPYRAKVEADGGIAPYSWRIIEPDLPGGLRITPDGVITGTARERGFTTLTFEVSDRSKPARKRTREFMLVVTDPRAAANLHNEWRPTAGAALAAIEVMHLLPPALHLPLDEMLPSTATYLIGIPVGMGKDMIDPVELNAWAIAAHLKQRWDIRKSFEDTYERAIQPPAARSSGAEADPERKEVEAPQVKSKIKDQNGILKRAPLKPGTYLGPFVFAARDTQPKASAVSVANVAPVVEPPPAGQISLSLLSRAITRKDVLGLACPTSNSFDLFVPQARDDSDNILTTIIPIRDPSAPALQFVQLTAEQWQSFKTTFPHVREKIGGYPIQVELASARPTHEEAAVANPTGWGLKQEESKAVNALLKLPRYRRPTLIVFDDSWPVNGDTEAFGRSVAFFCDAFHKLWAKQPRNVREDTWHGESECEPRMLHAAPPVPRLDPQMTCTAAKPCRAHSERIQQALRPLIDLKDADGESPVNVVYLPFNAAQEYSWDLIYRLLLWRAAALPEQVLVEHVGSERRVAADRDRIAAITAFEVMSASIYPGGANRRDRARGPEDPLLPTTLTIGKTANTNLVLLDALLVFARRYSYLTGDPILVNLSWTFGDIQHKIELGNDGFDWSFAAAGNNCDPLAAAPAERCTQDYAHAHRVERFAYDSLGRDRLVAVMNLDDAGHPTCKSTRLMPENFGLGLSGDIGDDCGTSFSSPRAAWLFGLYQSRVPQWYPHPPGPPDSAALFYVDMLKVLQASNRCHDPVGEEFSCLRFDIGHLQSLIQQGNTQ